MHRSKPWTFTLFHSYQKPDVNWRRETRSVSITGTMQSWQNKTPFPEKMKRQKKKGHKHRNQEEPGHNNGTEPISFPEKKTREEGRQAREPEPEPGGTRKSWWNRTSFRRKDGRERKGDKHQNILMQQNPFPEGTKKREEGRQAPEPEPEAGGTRRSCWINDNF